MSIYSCYLVTQAAMQQFGLSKIPDQWFNWSYVHAPIGTGKPVTLSRIEVVPSGVSGRVQEWYTQVTEAGLASTFILMTDEDDADFPLTAKDPWGGGADIFLGLIIPGDASKIAGWTSHLSQPDELAVLEWLDHQLGGGGDCNRYFRRVNNFAHHYASELKRWIAIEANAELLAEQWEDVRGWPEASPPLTVDDFAWDRKIWVGSQLAVPMRRLPFCEIGFDKLASQSSTNGLLPDERKSGHWLFDRDGSVEANLKRLAYAEDMTSNRAPVAVGREEPAGGVLRRGWQPLATAQPVFFHARMAANSSHDQGALLSAEPEGDTNEAFTIYLGSHFSDKTLFPDTAAEVDPAWNDARLTIQWHTPERTSVAFKAIRVPSGWDLQITLASTDTPLLLTAENGHWVELPVATNTKLRELKGTIAARRVPAPD